MVKVTYVGIAIILKKRISTKLTIIPALEEKAPFAEKRFMGLPFLRAESNEEKIVFFQDEYVRVSCLEKQNIYCDYFR